MIVRNGFLTVEIMFVVKGFPTDFRRLRAQIFADQVKSNCPFHSQWHWLANVNSAQARVRNVAPDPTGEHARYKDLQIRPSNRLEKLKGNLRDYYSIRINDQWRLIFKWESGNALEVKIVDYH